MLATMTHEPSDDPRREPHASPRVSTGIDGLDAILSGGLPEGFMYAVQGDPGVGKTTIGLQFLRAGMAQGQRVLYMSLAHPARELDVIARSHGWSIDGMPIHEFSAVEASDQLTREQTVFSAEEIEFGEMADTLIAAIDAARPDRIVIDAVEQLRLLSDRPQRYRRQLLLLKRALDDLDCCTTLFLADMPTANDHELESMVHGVIQLERRASSFSSVFRRLQVTKGRAMVYLDGYHTFRILTGGVVVYPRVRDTRAVRYDEWRTASSGIAELDALLGGGLEHGTTALLVGATGTGKSVVVTRYAIAAAERGDRVAIFMTDERRETFVRRAAGLSMDVAHHVEAGTLALEQVDLSDLPHGAFAEAVRAAVEDEGATVVILDSLTGYLCAMEEEGTLTNQVHELLAYLSDRGVLTILSMTESGFVGGSGTIVPLDISHFVDTVVLLRRFEEAGRVQRAITVIKKRNGAHDHSVRELRLDGSGITIGGPLSQFTRVLAGDSQPHDAGAHMSDDAR